MADRLAIIRERASDVTSVMALMDRAFAPGRQKLTAYRLRDGQDPAAGLSFIAIDAQRRMRGSLRFYQVGPGRSLLLGPLAVDQRLRGGGVGSALVRRGIDSAAFYGWDLCFVVGQPGFYTRFGFTNAAALGFAMPGWVSPRRFMVKELQHGAITTVTPGTLTVNR